jgi:hypothetical protein
MQQTYTDVRTHMLAQVAPGVDPRHIKALLTAPDGRCGLDDLDPEQAAFCISMAKACIKVFGADLVEKIAKEREAL